MLIIIFTEYRPCCGSSIPTANVLTLSPFQRVLTPITTKIAQEDIFTASQVPAGRIGDLKVETIPDDLKARLSWTSPDMGGLTVARYEIRYAETVEDIIDKFEINATKWEEGKPFPLHPGSETTFTLDLSENRNLLDKPLYFAVKAYSQLYSDVNSAPISNWVRVLIPSPPTTSTVFPTYTSNNENSWPFQVNTIGLDTGPSIAKNINLGLEIILPVVIGVIVLVILLILYCYCYVLKKRTSKSHKKSGKQSPINDKLNSTITIIPSSPGHVSQTNIQPSYTNQMEIPDPHTVGVPLTYDGYDDDPKKRYSLVHQQEQQLIEELKQQQMQQHQQMQQMQREQVGTPGSNYGGVSVISNNSLQRNGHTLSPFNSWSASQLLHEHERRHSPMEQEDPMLTQHQEMLMNGSQIDHMSLNGQNMDHISMNGHQIANQIPEHYGQGHVPPPVPPLPTFTSNGYPINYNIYGVHQPQVISNQNHPIYQSMQRNEPLAPFNQSLQGSLSSVNSGEKKRRNVTMV